MVKPTTPIKPSDAVKAKFLERKFDPKNQIPGFRKQGVVRQDQKIPVQKPAQALAQPKQDLSKERLVKKNIPPADRKAPKKITSAANPSN